MKASANGSTFEPSRLIDCASSERLSNPPSGEPPAPPVVAPASPPRPRSEKSVTSLAGGSLVMVGVIRSMVPVSVTVTSMGPDSISERPPLTRASSVTSKYGSMRNGFWKLMVPRVTR